MTSAETLPDGVCRSEDQRHYASGIEFKCVPFEGLKERPFKLRLRLSLAIVLYWYYALFSWKQCRGNG